MNEQHTSVTIYDIAAEAGVSASTVSRALRRPERVSIATAEKVRAAADKLGYKAEGTQHRPPMHRTLNIGMVLADITNPFFQEVLRGAEHAARQQGMNVLAVNVDEGVERSKQALTSLHGHVDGLLLASSRLDNSTIEQTSRAIPTVVINRPVPGVASVLVDNYGGTVKAAEHLMANGAHSITYFSGPQNSWADSMRWRALLDTTGHPNTAAGTDHPLTLAAPPRLVRDVTTRKIQVESPTILGGRIGFSSWLEHPTDAVVCFNDLVAIGFMQQAREAGYRVPADVMVVGFDNTELTTLVTPSITTVAGPLRSVGRVAAANLMAMTLGTQKILTRPRILPTRLIARESTRT
ncbi:LacI family DNA-binding transcriptional regulator [Corynebacterium renale]|uniref:LacI family transcriptional regulator n=1 Tax=Corynebacterium renale TaxID=1724 RepID=A0A2A9DNF6_9CORY|nr:LacI family DNA-binding transcriptional regulator [Corynebacterium renale]PFG28133.1 LacI family transcriptional regulator [Corynebacterium renale]SQI20404.1 transcriptional regulator [Corynebacterium renale]